jgi:hypothetical protein
MSRGRYRLTPYDQTCLIGVLRHEVVGHYDPSVDRWRFLHLHGKDKPSIATAVVRRMYSRGYVSINYYSSSQASVSLTEQGRKACELTR